MPWRVACRRTDDRRAANTSDAAQATLDRTRDIRQERHQARRLRSAKTEGATDFKMNDCACLTRTSIFGRYLAVP